MLRDFMAIDFMRKSRRVRSEFAGNLIASTRFDSFLAIFRPTVLSNLRHLRIYDICRLRLVSNEMSPKKNGLSVLAQTLSSFRQLQKVEFIGTMDSQFYGGRKCRENELKLKLPMCTTIHFENLLGIEKVAVEAPTLRKIKLVNSDRSKEVELSLVHGESVERLATDGLVRLHINDLRNLRYVHIFRSSESDLMSVSRLEQFEELEELHLHKGNQVLHLERLLQQKPNLRVYRFDYLLNGSRDPLAARFEVYDQELLVYLAEQPARLVNEIPFCESLPYEAIERVAPESTINLLNRFTDLREITVNSPVQDIQRFLDLLKSLRIIVRLEFAGAQPQELFDQLPEHLAAPELVIRGDPSNLRFLLKLKHLTVLNVPCLMDFEFILSLLKDLRNLSELKFNYLNKKVEIYYQQKFLIFVDGNMTVETKDLNVAMKRMAEKLTKKGWGELAE